MWWGRNPGVWWGGVLVIIGALFLLANLGVLNNLDWNVIWPLVLIAVGAWLLLARIGPGSVYADVDSAEAREGLAKAKLELAVGSAQVDVRASSLEGDQLYKVHIEHGGTSPRVELDRATGTVRISQRPDWFTGARRLHVDARITDAIPWEVSCNTGAIRGDFDLSTAAISAFDCKTGASRVDVALGSPKGAVPIRVQGGALTVNVTRPLGVQVSVQASGGAVQLRADRARDDGIGSRSWKSDGFDAAKDRYEIAVSGGALSIELGLR